MFDTGEWYEFLQSKGVIGERERKQGLSWQTKPYSLELKMQDLGLRPSQWRSFFEAFYGHPYLLEKEIPPLSEEQRRHFQTYGWCSDGKRVFSCFVKPETTLPLFLCEQEALESSWQKGALQGIQAQEEASLEKPTYELSFKTSYQEVDDFIKSLLYEAIERRATDVHFDLAGAFLEIRLRIDGHLTPLWYIPGTYHSLIVNRLKVLADIDIAERKRPQDGQFRGKKGELQYNFRVATLGLRKYEKVVLRILPTHLEFTQLSSLGLREKEQEALLQESQKKQGLILLTGPTNSGKSTLMYALLQQQLAQGKAIFTIEDPIEKEMEGLFQVQVNGKIGLDFTTGLRGIMRQDPDIIAVGEIRDFKTAETAFQAALTGHLVYGTLHTTDAASVISRLRQMGVSNELIASGLTQVVNERLVRRICPWCQGKKACLKCHSSGYYGRLGLYEVWTLNAEDKKAIETGRLITKNDFLNAGNYHTLEKDAQEKIAQKLTSFAEVQPYLRGEHHL